MPKTEATRCEDLDHPVLIIKEHRDPNGNYFCCIEISPRSDPSRGLSMMSTATFTTPMEALSRAVEIVHKEWVSCPADRVRQIIDTYASDREWVRNFEHQVGMLIGMVEEMFETNRVLLLSPVMRELVLDKGREVGRMLDKVRHILAVDNPGKPL